MQDVHKAREGYEAMEGETRPEACLCGKSITFTCTDLCEDCWVARQGRWHGHDQSVKIAGL